MLQVDFAQLGAVDLEVAAVLAIDALEQPRKVDFPEPLRPTRPSMVPGGISKETRSSAVILAPG